MKTKIVNFNFILPGILVIALPGCKERQTAQPNILFCVSDDQSFPHMGAYGTHWIKTPGFDRVAENGILFQNAYTPNAKSTPSRSCILTGRNPWQLKEAANQRCYFPAEFKTYPEVFKENGYYVGFTGKGWGPGDPGMKDGKPRELAGKGWNSLKTTPPTNGISEKDYAANFEEFYNNKPRGKPFCFWYGSTEPHRGYEYGSSIKSGKKLSDIDNVPGFLPDNEVVRTDLLDYGLEIEYFDQQLSKILEFLDKTGDLDNTIVIVTSDNGMSFPRGKDDAYDNSLHMPLAIMWTKGIKKPGRIVSDYVSSIDFAPTFLDIAGIKWEESGMQPTPGKSLKTLFRKAKSKDPFREYILTGKEKHGIARPGDRGYPIRGIIKDGWLFIINYSNELWPLGNPELGYAEIDGSPTKTEILRMRRVDPRNKFYWEKSFAKRPREELYCIKDDPDCMVNLAESPEKSDIRNNLKQIMESELIKEEDPRMFGNGDIFQNYRYLPAELENAYERIIINGETNNFGWINKSDIEMDFVEK